MPSRNDLKVLVHSQLLEDRKVAFVKSKEPTASQILELIEEGRCLPANLEGLVTRYRDTTRMDCRRSAAYPVRFDDEFCLCDDSERCRQGRPKRRASFHISLASPGDRRLTADLGNARRVPSAVGSGKGWSCSRSDRFDRDHLRLDLTKAGWHHKPFKSLNAKGEDAGPAEGTLFDVVLLEYPHASFPENSPRVRQAGNGLSSTSPASSTCCLRPRRLVCRGDN